MPEMFLWKYAFRNQKKMFHISVEIADTYAYCFSIPIHTDHSIHSTHFDILFKVIFNKMLYFSLLKSWCIVFIEFNFIFNNIFFKLQFKVIAVVYTEWSSQVQSKVIGIDLTDVLAEGTVGTLLARTSKRYICVD